MTENTTNPEKLSDLKPNPITKLRMKNGKTAQIGEIAFDVICWAEEKYGDLKKFLEVFSFESEDKLPPMRELLELLYQMLENKDDYKDYNDFARNLPLSEFQSIASIIVQAINGSFPVADPSDKDSEESGEPQAG